MKEVLTYDDVLLVPQYSTIRSRCEVDTSTDLGNGLELKLPIISSPMDTVTGATMAYAMHRKGGSGIIHRYCTISQQTRMIENAFHDGATTVGAAIGVSGDFLERAQSCLEHGARYLCVDVAHGHHVLMKEALDLLRRELGDEIHIMAGNVANLQGINDVADWGANSVRCNIGGGSICSTRIQTGHGMPGLETIFDCARTDRNVTIIADGGIRNSGDIVKALAAGANAVMLGSLLAGTRETPGEIITYADGSRVKNYRGMASKEAQVDWRGRYSSFEGVSTSVPYRGIVSDVLNDLDTGIRSGLSYSGARNIEELHNKAQFVRQTQSGLGESRTHIANRKW